MSALGAAVNLLALTYFCGVAVPVLELCKDVLLGSCARQEDKLVLSESSSSEEVAGAAEEKNRGGMEQLDGVSECMEEDLGGGEGWPV